MTILTLCDTDAVYPARLRERMGDRAPSALTALGNLNLLALPKTALFCSARCPGNVILAAHDQSARWRDEGRCVIGGFHSPIEKECLRILLRGRQPVILCPARGLGSMRVPPALRQYLTDGRLLVLSKFPASERRVTRQLAIERNELVAALADELVFVHKTPAGHLHELSQRAAVWRVPQRVVGGLAGQDVVSGRAYD